MFGFFVRRQLHPSAGPKGGEASLTPMTPGKNILILFWDEGNRHVLIGVEDGDVVKVREAEIVNIHFEGLRSRGRVQVVRIAGSRIERCGLRSGRRQWWWRLGLDSQSTRKVNNERSVEVGSRVTFDILHE